MEDLHKIGENGLLGLIEEWVRVGNPVVGPLPKLKTLVGIGDDCASIELDDTNQLLISKDLLIENVHFRSHYMTPEALGYRALAVNISDIAAMGGMPTQALIGLGLPAETPLDFLKGLYRGILDTGNQYGVNIIGGDTVRTPGPIIICVTIVGFVENAYIIRRKGARAGDKIMVTGDLGGAGLGFEILEESNKEYCSTWGVLDKTREGGSERNNKRCIGRKQFGNRGIQILPNETCLSHNERPEGDKSLTGNRALYDMCEKFLHPVPRLKEARILAQNRLATSMIDLSDSLSQDIYHLCLSSNVGARIYKRQLPIASGVRKLLHELGKDPYQYALSSGEEYELLFTVKPEDVQRVEESFKDETGTSVCTIGEIISKQDGIVVIEEDNSIKNLKQSGFEHF